MRETLYTIPVWDAFVPGDECPICRMYRKLEEQAVDGMLGPAVMEPSVREETNRLGFCPRHLRMMEGREGKLPLALLLQTRLAELQKGLHSGGAAQLEKLLGDCAICRRLDRSMAAMAENVALCWREDPAFREAFAQLDSLCPDHGLLLLKAAKGFKGRDFRQAVAEALDRSLGRSRREIGAFCSSFDYRNAGKGAASAQEKRAVSNAVQKLSAGRGE